MVTYIPVGSGATLFSYVVLLCRGRDNKTFTISIYGRRCSIYSRGDKFFYVALNSSSAFHTPIDVLKLRKVCAQWVPHLTYDQKSANHITVPR